MLRHVTSTDCLVLHGSLKLRLWGALGYSVRNDTLIFFIFFLFYFFSGRLTCEEPDVGLPNSAYNFVPRNYGLS
mgnify:CR=1 FL=1